MRARCPGPWLRKACLGSGACLSAFLSQLTSVAPRDVQLDALLKHQNAPTMIKAIHGQPADVQSKSWADSDPAAKSEAHRRMVPPRHRQRQARESLPLAYLGGADSKGGNPIKHSCDWRHGLTRPAGGDCTLLSLEQSTVWKSLFAVLAIAVATPAPAADLSASTIAQLQAADPSGSVQRLYEECTGTNKAVELYCVGYVAAMVESMMVVGSDDSAHAFGICPATSVNSAAAVQAFKNWAQKHPEYWGVNRYFGVAQALQELWPCS
jgi:hypothetical protein